MPNPERKKLFVTRKEKHQPLLEYLEQKCRRLYNSDVFFDKEGNIFYRVWFPADRTKVEPEIYHRLSRRRESEVKYLKRPLTSLTHHEARVNQIKKDGGGYIRCPKKNSM